MKCLTQRGAVVCFVSFLIVLSPLRAQILPDESLVLTRNCTVTVEEAGFEEFNTLSFLVQTAGILAIPFSELETIENLELSVSKHESRRATKIKSKHFTQTAIASDAFYAGYQAWTIPLEPGSYQLSYSLRCAEAMLFTQVSLVPSSELTQSTYQIVSNDFTILYDKQAPVIGLEEFQIAEQENGLKLHWQGPLDGDPVGLRVFAVPAGMEGRAEQYLSSCYQQLVSAQTASAQAPIAAFVTDCPEHASGMDKTKWLFEKVRNEIGYLDVENGIGAIQPRPPEQVLAKQRGDCKDMALVAHLGLKALGIKSDLALSASLSHRYRMDFPSLASANHVVCLAYVSGDTLLLDATDSFTPFGWPSSHTQGTRVLTMGDQPAYFTLPSIPADSNQIWINGDLDRLGESSLNFKCTGYLASWLRQERRNATSKHFQKRVESMVQKFLPAGHIEWKEWVPSDTVEIAFAYTLPESPLSELMGEKYVSLANVPRPFEAFHLDVKEDEPCINLSSSTCHVNLHFHSSRPRLQGSIFTQTTEFGALDVVAEDDRLVVRSNWTVPNARMEGDLLKTYLADLAVFQEHFKQYLNYD